MMYISAVFSPNNVYNIPVAFDDSHIVIPNLRHDAEEPRSSMKPTLRLFCLAAVFLFVRHLLLPKGRPPATSTSA